MVWEGKPQLDNVVSPFETNKNGHYTAHRAVVRSVSSYQLCMVWHGIEWYCIVLHVIAWFCMGWQLELLTELKMALYCPLGSGTLCQ